MFKKIKSFLWMLVEAPKDPNKVSQTKLWSNIGMLAMTIVFLHMGYTNTMQEWYAWIYAPSVACPHLVSKFISLRWGWGDPSSGEHPANGEYFSSRSAGDCNCKNSVGSDTTEPEDYRDSRR
nr:MAG TPA: Protein of unknown function (DUF2644) [Caudoviricetes sp.]